jgi:hypothetical protein
LNAHPSGLRQRYQCHEHDPTTMAVNTTRQTVPKLVCPSPDQPANVSAKQSQHMKIARETESETVAMSVELRHRPLRP